MSLERLIAPFTRRQHALVTLHQMRSVGVTDAMRDTAMSSGRLERVHAEVYRLSAAPAGWHQSLLAACLVAGGTGVVSHRAAATLLGLPGPQPRGVEITVPRGRCPVPDGVIVHRSRDLAAADIITAHGIPATHPLRLFADLGAGEPISVVRYTLRTALAQGDVTKPGLETTIERIGRQGRRGIGILRALVAELPDAAADVAPEYAALAVFHAHGLYPAFQKNIYDGGRFVARGDYVFDEALFNVEFKGGGHYTTWKAIDADDEREAALAAIGYLTMGVTWHAFRRDPSAVMARVRRVRASRLLLLGSVRAA
jgi:hypothetical protein